jgi:hypothetical protein
MVRTTGEGEFQGKDTWANPGAGASPLRRFTLFLMSVESF